MREEIYNIIEVAKDENKYSAMYDGFMIVAITISIIPLMFRDTYAVFPVIAFTTAIVFIFDYILRWITADFKLKKGVLSFIIYPFTVSAIIDMLSILPSITVLHRGFKLLRLVRLTRAFRLLRLFKAIRYSKTVRVLHDVVQNSREPLIAVTTVAVGYIFVSALLVFNVEPDTFDNFFNALYWSVISLTTVGYGDLYPVTAIGRFIAMLSSFFGVAIIALPTGVITAGYMESINGEKEKEGESGNQLE